MKKSRNGDLNREISNLNKGKSKKLKIVKLKYLNKKINVKDF